MPDPVLAAALEQQPSEQLLEPPAKRARSSDTAVEDLLNIKSAKQR